MRIEQDPWIAFKPGEIRNLLIQFGARVVLALQACPSRIEFCALADH